MNRPYNKSTNPYGNDQVIYAQRAHGYHITVTNGSSTAFWAQLFDSATQIASGTGGTSDFEVQVPAGGTVAFPFHKDGWPFGKGIYVRPVTAAGGTTTVTGNPAKITGLFDPAPLS